MWVLSAIALLLLWSQALAVPFWQDDYIFKQEARQAIASHQPWTAILSGEKEKWCFWRPLSIDVYWRLLEGTFGDSRLAAHLAAVALLLAASAAVGSLATAMLRSGDAKGMRRRSGGHSRTAGIAAAFVYGIHGSHFLPAVWACGNQDSMLVLLLALALAVLARVADDHWPAIRPCGRRHGGCIRAGTAQQRGRCSTAALNAALGGLGLAAATIGAASRADRPGCRRPDGGMVVRTQAVDAAAGLLIPDPHRSKRSSQCVEPGLFALNVPRKALRFLVTDHSPAAAFGRQPAC